MTYPDAPQDSIIDVQTPSTPIDPFQYSDRFDFSGFREHTALDDRYDLIFASFLNWRRLKIALKGHIILYSVIRSERVLSSGKFVLNFNLLSS